MLVAVFVGMEGSAQHRNDAILAGSGSCSTCLQPTHPLQPTCLLPQAVGSEPAGADTPSVKDTLVAVAVTCACRPHAQHPVCTLRGFKNSASEALCFFSVQVKLPCTSAGLTAAAAVLRTDPKVSITITGEAGRGRVTHIRWADDVHTTCAVILCFEACVLCCCSST